MQKEEDNQENTAQEEDSGKEKESCAAGEPEEKTVSSEGTDSDEEIDEENDDEDEDEDEDDDSWDTIEYNGKEVSYEEAEDLIRADNDEYLDLFVKDLETKGLSDKTIRTHLTNMDFYLNSYLLYEEPCSMQEGAWKVDSFLGEFFIRKCLWSTPSTIKSTAASIKKFYKCMLDHGKISKSVYEYMIDDIRDNLEEWQETCRIYNDPDQPNPFEGLFW